MVRVLKELGGLQSQLKGSQRQLRGPRGNWGVLRGFLGGLEMGMQMKTKKIKKMRKP